VQVEDYLQARVRMPADLLRSAVAGLGIVLLGGLGLLARATASGVEVDLVGASRHVPISLSVVGVLATAALLVLPVALAVRLLMRGQPRRLAEAALTGIMTVIIVVIVNAVLRQPFAAPLHQALIRNSAAPASREAGVLDGYLAGLVAYIKVISLVGRPRWRTTFLLAIIFYGLASLADTHTTVLSLLITLLVGSGIGSGMRYATGAVSERPSAREIAAALTAVGQPVTAMRRVWDARSETRRYAATMNGGGRLDVTVFDRDQQAADALHRLYRRLRLKAQVSRSAPLTVERAVERRALLTYAAQEAGIATPRLLALVRVGPEAAVLANEHCAGTTLAEMESGPSDAELEQVWDTVLRLHRHRVTHRALTSDRILLAAEPAGCRADPARGGRQVVLLDPGNGDVAASDLQLRLDLAQLLAETALLVGPERSARVAHRKIGSAELSAVVPLLQPVVLHRSTRAELRRHREVLPALRKRLLAAAPDGQAAPVRLERIRLRTLATMVASVIAGYILLVQFAKVNLDDIRDADWAWSVAALGLSAITYVGAAWSLSGYVLERLSLVRTFLVQLAGSFITLVAPAAVGGVALNLRYLRRARVDPADAAASVGVSQVVAFATHMLLLVIFAAITGSSQGTLRPPGWVYVALAVLVAAILAALAFPGGRRLLRSRIAPALGEVIPRLMDTAQRPAKLAEGLGGTLLVTGGYIFCLAACVRAMGGSAPIAALAVVYLTGSALGSVVPTPGGLGAVEAALVAGLSAAGLPGDTAVSSVLLYRILTFWLPVPLGWASLHYLQRHDAV
jgi:uncharacterized membrane protein YbhN (UPF0104 family)/tRNA A-37 threonylcarbamoyl transferase component Bud32